MKLLVGDMVLVTAGKDKGKQAKITQVFPKENVVVVEGVNMYSRHYKPSQGQPGRIVRKERPLSPGKVAIINDKGERDRIGYQVAKDGSKVRIYKKTGKPVVSTKLAGSKKSA